VSLKTSQIKAAFSVGSLESNFPQNGNPPMNVNRP
jgi:hypothetical protein